MWNELVLPKCFSPEHLTVKALVDAIAVNLAVSLAANLHEGLSLRTTMHGLGLIIALKLSRITHDTVAEEIAKKQNTN